MFLSFSLNQSQKTVQIESLAKTQIQKQKQIQFSWLVEVQSQFNMLQKTLHEYFHFR